MMKKKGYKTGGGPLPMKKGPDGKMVPEFAMDGEGANDLKKDKTKKFRAGMMVNGMKKKGYAKGGMKKKGYKKGGKVRGAGIARKGVRPCKMR